MLSKPRIRPAAQHNTGDRGLLTISSLKGLCDGVSVWIIVQSTTEVQDTGRYLPLLLSRGFWIQHISTYRDIFKSNKIVSVWPDFRHTQTYQGKGSGNIPLYIYIIYIIIYNITISFMLLDLPVFLLFCIM